MEQDIETFKINENILEKILTNLLQLFIFNNKVNNCLIRQTKNLMVNTNREKQEKKEIVEHDVNTQIKNLKRKLENKNEKIKQIKNEKFQEHNDYLINLKKMRDEQNDLVKLLKQNMGYFNKYKDSQLEIKEKNDIIVQQRLDFNEKLDKHYYDKAKLEEENTELKEFIRPIQDDIEIFKEKNKNLEDDLCIKDEIMKQKNQIIYRLQEIILMKEEELNTYIYNNDKLKERNEKMSENIIALKNKYQTLSNKKYGFSEFEYIKKIKDD